MTKITRARRFQSGSCGGFCGKALLGRSRGCDSVVDRARPDRTGLRRSWASLVTAEPKRVSAQRRQSEDMHTGAKDMERVSVAGFLETWVPCHGWAD